MRLKFIAVAFFCLQAAWAQSPIADSLKSVLYETPLDKKIDVYQSIIIILWLNHPDTAMHYAQQAVSFSRKANKPRDLAIAVRLLGGVHLYLGNYDSALIYSKQALDLSGRSGDSTLISSSFNNIGFTHYHFGNYPEALENLLRALNMKYKLRQDYGLGQTLNNIGLVYFKMKDYTKAREYFNEALKVGARTNDSNITLYSSNNIASTYLDQGTYSLAEMQFKQSLLIAKKVSNANWHATAYSGLGQVYFHINNINLAQKHFMSSLALRNSIGDKNGISEIYHFMSRIKAKEKNLDSAFYFLRLSQAIVRKTKAKERRLANFNLAKDLHIQKGKYDSAVYFQERFIELRDSLFNENMARNMADIQLRIQEEETLKRLAAKDIQLQKKTYQTYYLIIVVSLTLVFSVLALRSYRRQKLLSDDLARKHREITNKTEQIETQKEALLRSNKELEKAQHRIQEQNKELAELNRQLQSTVDIRTKELEIANKDLRIANLELDNFIYKSSHDIKGPLARLLGVCHVALLDVKETQAREYFTMLYTTARHLNDIFDRLKTVSDINTLQLTVTSVNFKHILVSVLDRLKTMDGFDEIDVSSEVEDFDYQSDPFLIEVIFYNMLENAIRFQKKSTEVHKYIKVRVTRVENVAVIWFIDNGIGIKETEADKIFNMFSAAALQHQTVGLGLYIVKQCVGKLAGTVSLNRGEHGTTEFEIRLPVFSDTTELIEA